MSDTRLHGFRTALFAALGLLPFAACGGSSTPGEFGAEAGAPDAGSPAEETGGTTNSGGRTTTGGRSASGGRTPAGGSGGASAGQPSAGTGNLIAGGYGGAQAGSIGVAGRPTFAGAGGAIARGGSASSGFGGWTAGTTGTGGNASEYPKACSPVPAPMASEVPSGAADVPSIVALPPIVHCEGGWKHRRATAACESALPRSEPLEPLGEDTCTEDADCTDAANGYCAPSEGNALPGNHCLYGCVQDSDCESGFICECGPLIGQCIAANCTTDADCDAGMLCASYSPLPGCPMIGYACQSPDDQCTSDADCAGETCTVVGDHRECSGVSCAIGRPFLIDGEERLATASDRSDWLETCPEPDLTGLGPDARESLADAWTRVALMEHASIAAFARFTLELLAFGAPAALVQSSSQAMRDEIEHARQAFALASVYAGTPRGPGTLDVGGSLSCVELQASVLNAFVEGCVGETVAALEAREAGELATDPAVRSVLSRVADEEARHALLAFEFVKWALPRGGASLRDDLLRALSAEIEKSTLAIAGTSGESAESGALVAHGILPEARRRALRRGVLLDVIAPCLTELARESASSAAVAPSTTDSPSSAPAGAQRITASSVIA
jgi:hypothetical protein